MRKTPKKLSKSSMARTTVAKRSVSNGAREAGNLTQRLAAKTEIGQGETTAEVVVETVEEAETTRTASTAVSLVTLQETAEQKESPEADQTIVEDTGEENLPEEEMTVGTDLEETTETAEEETTQETREEEVILTRRDHQVAIHLQEDHLAREETKLMGNLRESRTSNDHTYEHSTSKFSS